MKTTDQPRKWERRSEERPAELMAAAVRLFAERGFSGTRLEDVAASAGVSKATVYRYFEGKEQLFEAVVRQVVTPNVEQARALVDAFDGSTSNLIRTLLRLLETALDGPLPAVLKLVIAEAGNFPELARLWADVALRPMLALLHGVVQRGVDRGEFRPVKPADVLPLIAAPVVLLALWKHSFGQHADIPMDPHAVLAAHAEILVRGLANTTSSAVISKGT